MMASGALKKSNYGPPADGVPPLPAIKPSRKVVNITEPLASEQHTKKRVGEC